MDPQKIDKHGKSSLWPAFRASFSNHGKKKDATSKRSPEGLPSRFLNTLTVYFSQTCTKCRPQASLRASGASKGHSRELPRGSPKSIFEHPYGVFFTNLHEMQAAGQFASLRDLQRSLQSSPKAAQEHHRRSPKVAQGALGAPGILQNPRKSIKNFQFY